MARLVFITLFSLLLCSCFDSSSEPKQSIAATEALPGEAIYTKNCKVCHAQGLNGAPIVGNQKMWEERAQQDLEILVEHAVNGFGLMPAKGGKTSLTTLEVTQAVQHMLSALE